MKIVVVIVTQRLEFDERVRKETALLRALGHDVQIVALEDANEAGSGRTVEGVPYKTLRLITRDFLPRKRLLWLKALELSMRLLRPSAHPGLDVLWVHDHAAAGAIFLGWLGKRSRRSPNRIVWDQHEVGRDRWIGSLPYRLLLSASDAVIHANHDRAGYVKSRVPPVLHDRMHVIENYPPAPPPGSIPSAPPIHLTQWLGPYEYVVYQGATRTDRKVVECIDAVYKTPNLRLVVVGPCDDSTKALFMRRWPDLHNHVFFAGWTDPADFQRYLGAALASLVFYSGDTLNTWLCAPNRMYHAILSGVPIICGPNPPMRRVVERFGLGVVCEGGGEEPAEIARAIEMIRADRDRYRVAADHVRTRFVFESQYAVIESALGDSRAGAV